MVSNFFFVCIFWLLFFWATLSEAQDYLLTLYSGITLDRLGEQHGVPTIKPTSAACKANVLLALLSQWPLGLSFVNGNSTENGCIQVCNSLLEGLSFNLDCKK